MPPIPPITHSLLGSTAAQRVQADDKAAQLRRAERQRRVTPGGTGETDVYEPQVESPHELEPVSDNPHRQSGSYRPPAKRRGKPARASPDATGGGELDVRA